jgi:hypothetical protein
MKDKTIVLTVVFLAIFSVSAFAGGSSDSPANSSSSRYLFEQNFAKNNVTKIRSDDGWGNAYDYLPNIGFSAGKRVVYNGFIQLLDSEIPDSALAILSKEELRRLRNTIYAKYGMTFQSADLTKHFQQFSWYSPKSSNVEGQLKEVDKVNIENIQAFENAVPNPKVTKKDLVGKYIEWFPVPSWSPELEINTNNTIEKRRWDNEDNWTGTYKIENGFLVVLVTEQGVSDYYSKLANWQWPDGVTYDNGKITYRVPIKMIFPVGDLTKLNLNPEYGNVTKREIGSRNWF